MPHKKNSETRYTPDTPETTWEVVRKEAIKALIPSAITLGGLAVITYFGYLSLLTRVSALESSTVNKEVQAEVDKRIEGKIDLLLNNFNLKYKE